MQRFVADGMLGRMTRWLRLLGCDVTYSNDASDDRLLVVAANEYRVLLTRDVELFRRARTRGVDAFFVENTTTPEQLAALARHYQIRLDVDLALSRCPTCGASLRQVETSEVIEKVPAGTLAHYTAFWICRGCSQVYWQGSHWAGIRDVMEKAKKLARCHSDSEEPLPDPRG